MKKKNKKEEKDISNVQKKETPKWFFAVLVLLPILFFVLLELSLRIFDYGRDIPQWINTGKGKYLINPELAHRYFNNVKTIPTTIEDVFDKEKKKNSFRVFVMGESSAAGYPYMPLGSFSRYIRKRLEIVYPQIPIEVVNVSMTAINSYTIRDLTPEVIEQKPDLVLIYTGHNEYYGALGVGSMESLGKSRFFVNMMLQLNKYKTIQLLKNIISSSIEFISENEELTGTLMSRMAKDQYISYNSDMFNEGLEQFRDNMNDVLTMFHKKGIPVILGKLVSNLKDQRPFISIKTEGYPDASLIFEQAKNAYKNNNIKLADSLFRLAKDLDGLRFRAPEKLNNIISELGYKFNYPVVSFDSIFEANCKNGIIGNELMTDHLHPNLRGYQLMGEIFYEAMKENNYLPQNLKPAILYEKQDSIVIKNFVFSDLDSLMGNNKIKLLKNDWPFIEKKYAQPTKSLFNPKNIIDSIAFEYSFNKYTWVDAQFKAANYYLKMNNIQGYLKHIDIILYQYPIIVEYYDQVSLVLMERKLYKEALKYLVARYNIEPNDYTTKWIGNIALFDGNYEKAIEYLSYSHKLNKNDAQVLYNLAGAYTKKGDYKKALNAINDCLKVNPKYPMADNLRQQLIVVVNEMEK